MNLNKRKQEINERLQQINIDCNQDKSLEDLTKLETEVDALNEERNMIDKKMRIENKTKIQVVSTSNTNDKNEMLESRGNKLKESRIITVDASEILLPQYQASELVTVPFKQVSTLVDKVKLINLAGGETYTKSYTKTYGEAGLTAEGGSYQETEPTYGYATITKVKVTAYTEVTEELEKLASLPYQAEVLRNIEVSLKKKIAQQILNGAGTANTFTGIFSDKAEAIDVNKDLSIKKITDTTLDDIVYSYGGDEEIEGDAVLILNKNDLRAFANLRTAEGRKVHTIDYNNHTIDGINYIISSHCKALSDKKTNVNDYVMAYGSLNNYEVPIFSPVEIGKSTDYKFKDGITCYKASVFTGGNVVGYNGFLRIKKAQA